MRLLAFRNLVFKLLASIRIIFLNLLRDASSVQFTLEAQSFVYQIEL